MILCVDLRDTVRSECHLYVFATPVISADIRSAVVETIFFTKTGVANAFDFVSESIKTCDVAARGAPRNTSRRTASVQKNHRLCSQDFERPPLTRSGRSPRHVHDTHATSQRGARISTKPCRPCSRPRSRCDEMSVNTCMQM